MHSEVSRTMGVQEDVKLGRIEIEMIMGCVLSSRTMGDQENIRVRVDGDADDLGARSCISVWRRSVSI